MTETPGRYRAGNVIFGVFRPAHPLGLDTPEEPAPYTTRPSASDQRKPPTPLDAYRCRPQRQRR